MAFAWIPKATVQAALGAMTLARAEQENNAQFIEYGQIMLTVAVFAICITAPGGAISINTFGTKWLTKDEDAKEAIDQEKVPTLAANKNAVTPSVMPEADESKPGEDGGAIETNRADAPTQQQ